MEDRPAKGINEKYCADCGALILLRAEICPKCGCRQIASQRSGFSLQIDPVTGPTILLVIGNVLWSGLGNLLVGDKRGWGFGFFNWVVIVVSIYTAFVPAILFFAFCSWQGYEYLRTHQVASGAPSLEG